MRFPAGSSTNFVLPGAPDRGPPSVFEPGVHHNVFTVTVRADRDLFWIINPLFTTARNDPALYCTSSCSMVPGPAGPQGD